MKFGTLYLLDCFRQIPYLKRFPRVRCKAVKVRNSKVVSAFDRCVLTSQQCCKPFKPRTRETILVRLSELSFAERILYFEANIILPLKRTARVVSSKMFVQSKGHFAFPVPKRGWFVFPFFVNITGKTQLWQIFDIGRKNVDAT